MVLNHGHPNFLWQTAIPIIVGWFTGHRWKNNTVWYRLHNHLNYYEILIVHTYFKNVFVGCILQYWWAKNPWFQQTIYTMNNFLYITSYSLWYQGSRKFS
jgi:hypothetical protein